MQQHHLPHHELACRSRPFRTLFQRMYRKYYGSAKHQSFLVRELPLMECPPFSSADICGYCVDQYHVPTDIEKYGCFFFGNSTIFLASSSQIYLDYGILSKYKIACKPQYKLLSMSVTFFSCENYHNLSKEYFSNSHTLAVWGLHSPLNHQDIGKVCRNSTFNVGLPKPNLEADLFTYYFRVLSRPSHRDSRGLFLSPCSPQYVSTGSFCEKKKKIDKFSI